MTRLALVLSCTAASIVKLYAQTAPPSPSRPMHITIPGTALREAKSGLDPDHKYSLAELVDFAESHNPETRTAWELAKQRAAQLGIARAALFPTVAVAALAQQRRDRVLFGSAFFRQDITSLQPTVSVYYTLLDFGARRGGIEAAQAGLLASDFLFNIRQDRRSAV